MAIKKYDVTGDPTPDNTAGGTNAETDRPPSSDVLYDHAVKDATASVQGHATAAQITKLDGIEAGADVTDATNVSAAGASMVLPNIAGLADDSYIAFEMETISVGETGTIGQTFYLKASDHLWYKADYNAAATATSPLVMLVGTMTFGEGSATGIALKRGFLRDDGGFAAWADGAPLFVGVSGALDDDEPTDEDDISRVVGYFRTDGSKRIVEFKPSSEWTVVLVP